MSKKRKINLTDITGNLPENNRQEIKSLISYINNILVIRIDELTEEVSRLKNSNSVKKFKLTLEESDEENG